MPLKGQRPPITSHRFLSHSHHCSAFIPIKFDDIGHYCEIMFGEPHPPIQFDPALNTFCKKYERYEL